MNRMLLGVALSFFCAAGVWANEPWAIMTGKSMMELRSGLRHIYQRLGRRDLIMALDGAAVTNLLTGNLRGLDISRPVGMMVLPDSQGYGTVHVFIPATSPEEFRVFLTRHLLQVEALGNEQYQIVVPVLGKLALRYEQGYAWISFSSDRLENGLPQMKDVLPAIHRENLLACTMHLERIPPDQRQLLQSRMQQGVQLLMGLTNRGEMAESLVMPMAGMLLQWLGQNAREITLIAHIDTRQDELLIQATITPLEQVPLLRALQSLEKKQIVLPASYWGKLRGKTPEQQQHAREQAFRNGEEDSLYLTMHGGETLQFQAAMKGTLLAYHAALDAQEQPARPRRERPWPRRPRRDPHIILQPSGPPHGIMPGNFIQGQ